MHVNPPQSRRLSRPRLAVAALAAASLAAVGLWAGLASAQTQARPAPQPAESTIQTIDLAPAETAPAPAETADGPPAAGQASGPPAADQTSGPAAAGQTSEPPAAPGGAARPAMTSGAWPSEGLTPFSGGGVNLVKAVGAFALVIALLLICLKIIGRLGRGRLTASGGRAFVLRGSMPLDSRRYLAAVEVDGHLLVVGVAPDRLTALADWPMADDKPAAPALRPPRPKPSPAKTPSRKPDDRPFDLGGPAGPSDEAFELSLALDEEPFDGPQANDDFLGLGPDRKGR
ncbi:MAG: flagellar biosynthetic protein FliO [Deltaproteobacteria bacterium]|jgi:flagellar biogenesis protein FliO|nr:flagellar biosynthetic protein FliO [Deltaproteobacteria bacterium]